MATLDETRNDGVPESDVVSVGTNSKQFACIYDFAAGSVKAQKGGMSVKVGVEPEL